MNSVADRIQEKMSELGLKHKDLVNATGASKGAVSHWLSGINTPSGGRLLSLARLLKTSPDWILTGKTHQKIENFNMQEFMLKHKMNVENESSFNAYDIQSPIIVNYEDDSEFIWIDVVEASFSCGAGESIEFHFDVVNGKQPFPPNFFYKKGIDPKNVKIIKAKGDSMAERIFDGDLVAIDMSQIEIIDGEIYAFYFAGEGMIKQIFKEADGSLILHSLNEKYKDKIVTEENGSNFKVMGRQFWRAG